MALGGGTFISQNKPLAGTYVNIISKSQTTADLSQRGFAGLIFAGNGTETFAVNTVKEILADEFQSKANDLFGVTANDASLKPIREVFKHATKAYVYKTQVEYALTSDVAVDVNKAYYTRSGTEGAYVYTLVAAPDVDDIATYYEKDEVSGADYTAFLTAIQNYPIHAVICDSTNLEIIDDCVEFASSMRNDYGIKLQVVVPYVSSMTAPNNEGVVCVYDNPSLVYWVGGACAGCAINSSLTNTKYNGELVLSIDHTQAELITLLAAGYFILHKVSDEYRVLEDVNTLTSTESETVDVATMKYNQAVRIADQIATDSAIIFNNEFLGKVQNNADGRSSLWNRIVNNRQQLELLGAIEGYSPEDTVISMGDSKRAVVINDRVTIVNTMSQLYLTVVVK